MKTERLNARVDKARASLQFKCTYKLGRGGFNPKYPLTPVWDGGRSDCSGFASYLLGMNRNQGAASKPWSHELPWLETTAIKADATGKQLVFVEIKTPVPGCLVVYGDKNGGQGHIELVETVRGQVNGKWVFDDIGCSAGVLGKVMGKAIRRRKDAQKTFPPDKAIFCVLKEDL